jgi:hypothetical protein
MMSVVQSAAFAPVLEILEHDPRVRLVYAFGSHARNEAQPHSDLDVAVLLDRKLSWHEESALRAKLMGSAPKVDLVILNDAPPVLRYEIVSDGSCLLARDADEQAEFEVTSLSRFQDFQAVRRLQQEYLRARVEERRGSTQRSAP